MKFKKGISGNPNGRPVGSSKRLTAINIVLDIFNEYSDQFETEMRKQAENDILKFYNDYVKELQPKFKSESGSFVLSKSSFSDFDF